MDNPYSEGLIFVFAGLVVITVMVNFLYYLTMLLLVRVTIIKVALGLNTPFFPGSFIWERLQPKLGKIPDFV